MNKLILNIEEVNERKEVSGGKGFYNTNGLGKASYLISKNNKFYCYKDAERGNKITYAFETSYYLSDCIKEYESFNGARIEYGADEWDKINKAMRECRHLWLDLGGAF